MKAEDIKGWMGVGELEWLRENAKGCSLVIEIGTFFGKSARAIGEVVSGKLITIDTFEGTPMEHYHNPVERGASRGRLSKLVSDELEKDPDYMYKTCVNNLKDLTDSGKVIIIRDRSDHAVERSVFAGLKADMVFIDGDHSYSAVKSDILNYLPLVKKGGWLCGHDHNWIGVKKAVEELLPQATVLEGSIWGFRV